MVWSVKVFVQWEVVFYSACGSLSAQSCIHNSLHLSYVLVGCFSYISRIRVNNHIPGGAVGVYGGAE